MQKLVVAAALSGLIFTGGAILIIHHAQAQAKRSNSKAVSNLFDQTVKWNSEIGRDKTKRNEILAELRRRILKVTGVKLTAKVAKRLNDADLDKLLEFVALSKAALDNGTGTREQIIDKFREALNKLLTGETNRRVQVKDPAGFKKLQKKDLFSGPQPGEKLPRLKVIGIRGKFADKEFDAICEAGGSAQLLIFLEYGEFADKPLDWIAKILGLIEKKTNHKLNVTVVFLGNDHAKLEQIAKKAEKTVSKRTRLTFSKEGREGPGAYGLNRFVLETIIFAKNGKVTHNFPIQSYIYSPDPHVLGAMAAVLGVERNALEEMLNGNRKSKQRGPVGALPVP